MVEGLNAASIQDVLENSLDIPAKLPSGNPQHPITLPVQPRIPSRIPRRVLTHLVRDPVNLHGQLLRRAIEIEHIGTGRVLVAEFETRWPCSQYLPEPNFGWRHGAAQSARLGDRAFCRLPH
jgi:hypothetical protein